MKVKEYFTDINRLEVKGGRLSQNLQQHTHAIPCSLKSTFLSREYQVTFFISSWLGPNVEKTIILTIDIDHVYLKNEN